VAGGHKRGAGANMPPDDEGGPSSVGQGKGQRCLAASQSRSLIGMKHVPFRPGNLISLRGGRWWIADPMLCKFILHHFVQEIAGLKHVIL